MRRSEKRQHLVDVAARLFNRFGYHGVGIDMVLAEAGIAKTTLYRHFKSKEDLIVAVLRDEDARFREEMRNFVDRVDGPPTEKLLATFDFLRDWFSGSHFYGCPFISAAAEYGDRETPVFQEAALHKRLMVVYFEQLAEAAKVPDPKAVAEEINLLHEGAVAVAHMSGMCDAALKAKALGAKLLESAKEGTG